MSKQTQDHIVDVNKKVTAVEWLEEIYLTTGIDRKVHFNQAKEMEKQQIIDACEKFGNLNGVDIEDFKQYYNETFKK
jgi:hypothetical protein